MQDWKNTKRPWVVPALASPEGVVGIGGDLRPLTLVRAYSEGIFPWFNEGDPIIWWSPDPRGIFDLQHFHVPRRLARSLRSGAWTTSINRCFGDVIRACAENREEGTWITSEMIQAYEGLHRFGCAHSLEVWQQNRLVGGIYGVAIGAFFAGESMFHRETDASKVALVSLRNHLLARGFELFDTQIVNDHTAQFGAIEIPRPEYLRRLSLAVRKSQVRFRD